MSRGGVQISFARNQPFILESDIGHHVFCKKCLRECDYKLRRTVSKLTWNSNGFYYRLLGKYYFGSLNTSSLGFILKMEPVEILNLQ